jgi:hypothetical protein
MTDQEQIQRLREIVGRLVDLNPMGNALLTTLPPFDISRPTQHDTKREFLAEQKYVAAMFKQVTTLLKLLIAQLDDNEYSDDGAIAVGQFIDTQALRRRNGADIQSARQLVVDGAARVGLSVTSTILLFEMRSALIHRKQDLESEHEAHWSGTGRAPNHYARSIALRFAKLIYQQTGEKPTFGTARDGGHPSTTFGRALEEIFEVLGIEATVKHPATWAIDQLSEEDKFPPPGSLASMMASPRHQEDHNTLLNLLSGSTKEPDQ